jgi:hypothetical protein
MIAPLTRSTIAGVIWYQGEADAKAGFAEVYNCTFPAMIGAWRKEWHTNSRGQTDALFPFGFVQLSAWGSPVNNPTTRQNTEVAVVRWAQRETHDTVARTFMATAIDLAAFQGGCGKDYYNMTGGPTLCIHPGYKQPVGARLLRGALSVAYGYSNTSGAGYSSGPTVKSATYAQDPGTSTMVVILAFQTTGASAQLAFYEHTHSEFDLSFDGGATWKSNVKAGLVKNRSCVQLVSPLPALKPTHVRYLWSEAPGTHPHGTRGRTTVYSSIEDLPVTPFVAVVTPMPSPPTPAPHLPVYEGFTVLGAGSCRDSAGKEPPFYSNTGSIPESTCAHACAADADCTGFGMCIERCAGVCHLYVDSTAPLPAPAKPTGTTWKPYAKGEGGDANHITKITAEKNWHCYVKKGKAL